MTLNGSPIRAIAAKCQSSQTSTRLLASTCRSAAAVPGRPIMMPVCTAARSLVKRAIRSAVRERRKKSCDRLWSRSNRVIRRSVSTRAPSLAYT